MHINVLEYLDHSAAIKADAVALRDGNHSVTFSDLQAAGHSVARRIISVADTVRCPIAIFLPKSIEAIIAFAGALYSANLYVPLDTKLPEERVRSILANLTPACVITNRSLLANVLATGWPEDKVLLIDTVDTTSNSPADSEIATRYRRLIDTDPAYVIYTSGSSGEPKGVTISHRGIIDYIEWASDTYSVNGSDILGSQAPFYFDNSTLDIYLCLSRGAVLDLIPHSLFSFPLRLMEYVRDAGITMIFWVPSLMSNIARFDIFASVACPALVKVLFAGEAIPARTLRYWRTHLPHALFSNLYGPTEITVDCTYFIVDRDIPDSEPVPIGSPCRNSAVLILTADNRPVSQGEVGELCVLGSSLALGYWNAPKATSSAFVQNPLHSLYPERMYRTGDLVKLNERNEILFVGRADSQIKHHGYRIELGEIETAANAIECIRAACVAYDAESQEIVLFYEAADKVPASLIRDELAKRLPRYMLPTTLNWVTAMPLNANGKIDRARLSNPHTHKHVSLDVLH